MTPYPKVKYVIIYRGHWLYSALCSIISWNKPQESFLIVYSQGHSIIKSCSNCISDKECFPQNYSRLRDRTVNSRSPAKGKYKVQHFEGELPDFFVANSPAVIQIPLWVTFIMYILLLFFHIVKLGLDSVFSIKRRDTKKILKNVGIFS